MSTRYAGLPTVEDSPASPPTEGFSTSRRCGRGSVGNSARPMEGAALGTGGDVNGVGRGRAKEPEDADCGNANDQQDGADGGGATEPKSFGEDSYEPGKSLFLRVIDEQCGFTI